MAYNPTNNEYLVVWYGDDMGPFGSLLDHVKGRGQVINRRRKMFDQVMHDPFDREDPHDATDLVDDREMAIAALFHATNSSADRFLAVNGYGIRGHTLCDREGQGLPARQHAAHQITFREDAHHALPFANQNISDALLAHQGDRLGDRLRRADS